MLSTKDLSGLPNAERLKNFCKGLAALDIIMLEEEWSFIRHYTYNPAWRKGKEAFFATDGGDQSMIVMFAPEGCVINGVDSELYDWEEKLPRIGDLTAGMPPALQKLMSSREVKKMKSTFCVWTEDGSAWHCNPMDGEDASKDLLPLIDGDPQTYVEYGKWFYPADLYEAAAKAYFGLSAEELRAGEDYNAEYGGYFSPRPVGRGYTPLITLEDYDQQYDLLTLNVSVSQLEAPDRKMTLTVRLTEDGYQYLSYLPR